MATQYLGAALGASRAAEITLDTSTTSLPIELAVVDTTIDLTTTAGKMQVINALEGFREKLLESAF